MNPKTILNRVPVFDERSRNYTLDTIRTSRASKHYYCALRLDQGTEGMCVGAGLTHTLSIIKKHLGFGFASQLYKEAQKIDQWPGEGYSGTSVLAGLQTLKTLGYIDEYRWAFSFDDFLNGILTHGPATLGLNWYEGMGNTNHRGYIVPTGKQIGGHCILCKGVNVKSEYFVLHNSWGDKWGVGGDCAVSFSAMERLLNERGEAAFIAGALC